MAGFGGGSSRPSKFTKRTEAGNTTTKPKPGKKKPEPKEKIKPEPRAKNRKPEPKAKRSKKEEYTDVEQDSVDVEESSNKKKKSFGKTGKSPAKEKKSFSKGKQSSAREIKNSAKEKRPTRTSSKKQETIPKEKKNVYQHLLREVLDINAPIESSSYYRLFAQTIKEENISGMLMLENNNRYMEDITQMIRELEYNERHDMINDFDVSENSEGDGYGERTKGINIV